MKTIVNTFAIESAYKIRVIYHKVVNIINRKTKIFLSILMAGIAGSAMMIATAPASVPQVFEEKIWPVAVVDVSPATLSPTLSLFGRVETPREASLTAALNAAVDNVHVREGDSVVAGQLLVSLDHSDTDLLVSQRQADVAEAGALLSQSQHQYQVDKRILQTQQEVYAMTQAKFSRYETLHKDNMVSDTQFDEFLIAVKQAKIALEQQQLKIANYPNVHTTMRAKLSRAQSLLAQAKLQLTRTQVVAPFDGKITHVFVATGNRLNVGSALVNLYDDSSLEVRTSVPTEQANQLRSLLAAGKIVTAYIRQGQQHINLQLNLLAAAIGQGRSGVDALFTLLDSNHTLELGRVVDIELMLPASENLIAVPVQSVYGNKRLYTVKDHRLSAVDVDIIGARVADDGQYELLVKADTITDTETILATQLPNAISGMKISIAGEMPLSIASDGDNLQLENDKS